MTLPSAPPSAPFLSIPNNTYLASALRGEHGGGEDEGRETSQGGLAGLDHLGHLVVGGRHLDRLAGTEGGSGHEAQGGLHAHQEDSEGEEDLHVD